MLGLIGSALNGTFMSPTNKEDIRDRGNRVRYLLYVSNRERHRYFFDYSELPKLQDARRVYRLLHAGHPNSSVQKSYPCSSISIPDSTPKAPRAYPLRSSLKISYLIFSYSRANIRQSFLFHLPPRFLRISTSRNPTSRAVRLSLRHTTDGWRNATSGTWGRFDELLGILRHTDLQSTSESNLGKDQSATMVKRRDIIRFIIIYIGNGRKVKSLVRVFVWYEEKWFVFLLKI